MLKLRKIYIDNFKGIGLPQIVDLTNCNFSILSGPNGFGKTTIFDVVELCLRGRLERTVQFSNVTKNNHDYKKPFYQNTVGKDVVLKLLFENGSTSEYHIITKFLDKDHNGRQENSRRFRPDAWGILSTYYTNDLSKFDEPFDKEGLNEISQQQVDQIFFGDQILSHQNLYPLFNYLQQEENIYFLKKDEEEKKSQLDFLFQTRVQAAELETITSNWAQIKNLADEIAGKIQRLGEVSNSDQSVIYQRLFPYKDMPYDREEPFLDRTTDELTQYYDAFGSELNTLSEFLKSFDPEEYNKDKARTAITFALTDRNLLSAFVLYLLSSEEEFVRLEELSRRRRTYTGLITTIEQDEFETETLLQLGFDKTFIEEYNDALQTKNNLAGSLSHLDKIIVDLLAARNQAQTYAQQLPSTIHDPCECPLCATKWESQELLFNAVDDKAAELKKYSENQVEEIEKLDSAIATKHRIPVTNSLNRFLDDPANVLDNILFGLINEYRGFRDRIDRFKAIIALVNISFDEFMLQTPVTVDVFREVVDKLEVKMNEATALLIPDEEKLLHKHLFKDLFVEDNSQLLQHSEVEEKIKYVSFKFNQARYFSAQVLSRRLIKFRELEDDIATIKDQYAQAIKRYKLEMIERIKIPFYLFSGKILQNYQQGLGIFIDMKQNTNRVRFLTDNNSDHDVVHHLSSGQLAVVSIAFCLALNKVYKTSQHFKFLAIDDPIQTLDDINVHSFIELLRHEFADYQILISTHEDDIASYLNYKFGVFGFLCNKINVQNVFFAT